MSAKIDTYSPSPARAAPSRGASQANAVSTPVSAGASSSKPVSAVEQTDRVQLTGDAVNLQQFQKAATEAPAGNRARVERIKLAVANGSYSIDPMKIAARLSRLDGELGA
jgi:negative regulator of flagellin synthesis FlgM